MRPIGKYVALTVACLALAGGCVALAYGAAIDDLQEKPIPVDKAPQGVQSALRSALPPKTEVKLTTEMDDGHAAYEAEYSIDGSARSLVFAEDGSIMEKEEQVGGDTLPAAVRSALKSQFPKGEVLETTRVVATYYEVVVKTGTKEREVKLLANGQDYDKKD